VFRERREGRPKEGCASGSRPTIFALLLLVLALAGCGGDEGTEPRSGDEAATATETSAAGAREASEEASPEPGDESAGARAAELARRPEGAEGLRVPARRARIVAKKSAFGRVLFDANGQVVYTFERDRRNRSNCTSPECVKAWPPVLTREQPTAGAGVDARLLGTIGRGDRSLQVTYNGRPLYFYEHETPGEIKCHNVDLHGGLWWVVTPRGDPAA
jgi:predicted lipoprotein with Yx(FWY)xxD motif